MTDRVSALLEQASDGLHVRPGFTDDVLVGGRRRVRRRRAVATGLAAVLAAGAASLGVQGSPTRNVLLPGLAEPRVHVSPNAPYVRVDETSPWSRAYAASGQLTVDPRLHRADETRYDRQAAYCAAGTFDWGCALFERDRFEVGSFRLHFTGELGSPVDEVLVTFKDSGDSGDSIATFNYKLTSALAWLDLPVGQTAQSDLYGGPGTARLTRMSATSWEVRLDVDGALVTVGLTVDAPRPPWRTLRFQLHGVDHDGTVKADLALRLLDPGTARKGRVDLPRFQCEDGSVLTGQLFTSASCGTHSDP